MKIWLVIVLCFLTSVAEARGPRHHPVPIPRGGGGSISRVFTPLHTYFMAANGNDANSGLDAAHPWATPNHAVVCGDVIIAAAGAYNGDFSTWGTVSNCPSASGGIDGAGGIYFAVVLCGGSGLNSCMINCATAACNGGHVGSGGRNAPDAGMNINSSNWAVEGFVVNGNGNNAGFQSDACLTQTTLLHHIAYINDIAFNAAQGFDPSADCAYNHNVPGNGVDYTAVVGSIAQNAAQNPICLGAIDLVAPANTDTNAGTHAFIHGNFSYNNLVSCVSDGESFLLDTLDAHNYRGTVVVQNNMGWLAERMGFNLFYQDFNAATTATIIHVNQNTFFGNNAGGDAGTGQADMVMQPCGGSCTDTNTWIIVMQNNISRTNRASNAGDAVYALNVGGVFSNQTIGGSGTQNIYKSLASGCAGTCDPGNNVVEFNGGSFGTNTYVDPAFTNTTDLLNNRSGAPNCTGFINVTQCMGWNASTATLTTPSVISDLTPTAGGTTGKGYQRSNVTCAANADFPTWLKGIVYLHWTGTAVEQRFDLVTLPCGL